MRDDDTVRIKEVMDAHPPISTEQLQVLLVKMAFTHDQAMENADAEAPIMEVSVCLLISVVNELLKYRDHYGLIELPDEWKIKMD